MSHTYIMYPDSSFLDRASFSLQSSLQHNYDGEIKDVRLTPSVRLNMKGQTYLYVSYQLLHNEKYNGINFKGVNRAAISLNSRPLKELSFDIYANLGKFIYRSSTPKIGNGHSIGVSITLKPTPNLNIEFSYDRA